MNEKLLTGHAVADRYSIAYQTMWGWVKAGKLPQPIYMSPHTPRWRLSDLEAAEAAAARTAA